MNRKKLEWIFAGMVTMLAVLLLILVIKGKWMEKIAVFSYQSGIDISKELDGGLPKLYQWDKRWADLSYGTSNMKISGCGPTCLSMVSCGLTKDGSWDPYTVAKMAESKGLYVSGVGTSWELMTKGAQILGLRGQELSFTKESILRSLRKGNPIICAVGPGDFTTEGHFIVLAGIDEDERVKVHDPNSRENSERTWDVERIMNQVKNLWVYEL